MGARTTSILGAALVAAALASPAFAQGAAAPPGEAGRFSFTPVEGGLMRLDTVTGAVSMCERRGGGWACRAVPEERAALEGEIGRLAAENDRLAGRLAELERRAEADRTGPPPVPPAIVPDPKRPPPAEGPATRELPSDAEIDKMMSYVEKVFRRFLAMVESLKPGAPQPPATPNKI